MKERPRFTLVGGGLAGALLAARIGQLGYEVDLHEMRCDPQAGNFVGGRSINLALSERGIHALGEVGVADAVLASAIPMRGRMVHSRSGDLHFQPYDKDPGRHINSIGRAALNSATIAAARGLSPVRIHFNHQCTEVDVRAGRARFAVRAPDAVAGSPVAAVESRTTESDGDIVIGVDGAFSAVRRSLQRLDRFDYSQSWLEHGYKELAIPPGLSDVHQMERHALHIWPRRSFMMIALPNPDGSFTCTLFLPFVGENSFASLRSAEDVRRFFDREFPDAAALMPTLREDFGANPTGSMVTVRCRPWHVDGRIALLGDAAHAVVPFYGQGANAAFEDVSVLAECIQEYAPDWEQTFSVYESRRRPNTDALADLAISNFVEMRDKTASRWFHLYKRIDRTLHRTIPRWYTPLYTLISFSRTPYAAAVRKARRQDAWLAGGLISIAGLALALLVLVLSAISRSC